MLNLILFASLILSVYSAPRYVIDDYTIPDTTTFQDDPQPSPYPLDVCVNYQVKLVGFEASYGMYTCSQDGNTVTFTDYGTDSTCTTADNTNDHEFTAANAASLGDGEVGKFNCDGEDDYVQVGAYTIGGEQTVNNGEDYCCTATEDTTSDGKSVFLAVETTFAVGVCVSLPDDGIYTSGVCDATGSSVEIYIDSACSVSAGSSTDSSSTFCGLFAPSSIASIYRMQTNCVINGVSMTPEKDYCPFVSSFPSASPTTAEPTTPYPSQSPTTAEPTDQPTTAEPTTSPTSMPTVNPTEATDEPTGMPTEMPTAVPATDNMGAMHFINHIVLLMIVMGIFLL